ncbi:50S ribosomal protein L17 [Desulfonatronovibrio hydrogenovorans]|uniref:50S ribosomal protein L17 n=1 Tax=Desulfonatronovibrio hydrogenovorans TaxID=53245 RepID=UPI0009FC65F8|nr:50S ribosomal protein L17 [Desulfonatronovibrio hydrogenovorans]
MRHRKSGKKLGRTWEHRKAMFRNMAKSLIVHERIKTTTPKAKELSKIVDRLVTLAVRNDLSARRQAYKVLGNHGLVQRLFNEIGPKFNGAGGGYTRIVKFATPRVGDNAAMALIEFTYLGAEQALSSDPKPDKAILPAADKSVEEQDAPVQSETVEPQPEAGVEADAGEKQPDPEDTVSAETSEQDIPAADPQDEPADIPAESEKDQDQEKK